MKEERGARTMPKKSYREMEEILCVVRPSESLKLILISDELRFELESQENNRTLAKMISWKYYPYGV